MTLEEIAHKIQTMEIRGAGKIARAAAGALKDYALSLHETDLLAFTTALNAAQDKLLATRPTAVSLSNAITFVMAGAIGENVDEMKVNIEKTVNEFISNSNSAVDTIGELCAKRISDGNTIMTHCNSAAALSGIIKAHYHGKTLKVFATETRPWHQGYITTQALADAGVDVILIVDSAARYFMKETDLFIIGADTITSDGSIINKIGTSQIALSASEHSVPVIVCAESYKFSKSSKDGSTVPIEERPIDEVITPGKLKGVKIKNPVFDLTPAKYISYIITESGEVTPDSVPEYIKTI
jgi:ribose 1,5-bisphosphate isomerase